MFKFGPFHKNRKQIVADLKVLPVQTGDIFYRHTDAYGPLFLPFGKIVRFLTKSEVPHASVALVEGNEIYIAEVNDAGTTKMRLIDWLDTCSSAKLKIYRLKQYDAALIAKLENEIKLFLEEDADYDVTFSSDDKFYCTESVTHIYQQIGIEIVEPEYIKNIVGPIVYFCITAISWIFNKLTGCHAPLDRKIHYVGNEKCGMMSSDKTVCVYDYENKPASESL